MIECYVLFNTCEEENDEALGQTGLRPYTMRPQALASRGKKGEFIPKYVDAAEIILTGQVYEDSAVEGMKSKTLSFPDFLSGKETVVLAYMEDYIEANTEGDIANDIGEQVFEAIAEGSLPRTAAELEMFTKSPY